MVRTELVNGGRRVVRNDVLDGLSVVRPRCACPLLAQHLEEPFLHQRIRNFTNAHDTYRSTLYLRNCTPALHPSLPVQVLRRRAYEMGESAEKPRTSGLTSRLSLKIGRASELQQVIPTQLV